MSKYRHTPETHQKAPRSDEMVGSSVIRRLDGYPHLSEAMDERRGNIGGTRREVVVG